MKFGVFGMNSAGGLALTTVPERWTAQWEDILAATEMADRAGIEFVLPLQRWLGYGGETDSRLHCFESMTQGAALAAATERIGILSTVHAPFVHPVFAAKALTTMDHISGGRAGFNIVCGWNEPEYAVFGIQKLDNVYELGLEWFEVLSRILSGEGPFDFTGQYFDLKGVIGKPASLQQPRPVMVSAAFSDVGRDFAAQTSDYIFTVFDDLDAGRKHMADLGERAAKFSREFEVLCAVHVVCRATNAEAEDYYEYYAVEQEEKTAVDKYMRMKKSMSKSHDPSAYDLYRKRFAAGAGSYPLIGSPQRIVEQMLRLSEIGITGIAASFVSYLLELPFFISEVLPLMEEAGLREARSR